MAKLTALFEMQDKMSAKFEKIIKVTEKYSDASKKMAIAGAAAFAAVGASAVTFGTLAVNEFRNFEKGMNEVFTLLPGISQESMGQMREDVKKFSKDFGALPEEVVPALYQSLSAGVPKNNVFEFLEVAQKAAEGGVTQLSTAVDGISSVVNAYGADILSATKASDLMFTAVKMGKTDFTQLSQSLYNVIPTASALGVQFGDVTAAMASMTAQGTPTSVATTQMRQLLIELSKAGGKPAAMFQKLSGKTFKDFIASGGNVQQALQLMEKQAGKMGIGINDLFGSVEAGNAALSLTGKGTEMFSNNLKEMTNATGATDKAYQQMQNGIDDALGDLQASFKVTLLDIGEKIAPFVSGLANGISDNMPAIQTAIGGVIDTFAIMADIMVKTLGFAGPMISGFFVGLGVIINFVKKHFDVLGPAIAAMIATILIPAFISWGIAAGAAAIATITAMAPLIGIALAVGLAVMALVWLWKNGWNIILGVTQAVMTAITIAIQAGKALVIGAITALISMIQNAFNSLIAKGAQIGTMFIQAIISGFTSLAGGLVNAAQGIWSKVSGIFGKKQTINVGVNGGPAVNGSHADGLPRVPFDGYIAELHKDEAVLTAEEARAYRGGNLSPKKTQQVINTSPPAPSSEDKGNQVSIESLIGEVTINNETDFKKLIQMIEEYLRELLFSSGEGVYDV